MEVILINILLVDDHTLFAKSLAIAFEEYKEIENFYTTQEIPSLEETIMQKNIDIVLMDINLGKLTDSDGLTIAGNLIKDLPALKLVILTGYDLPVYKYEAQKLKISGDYLKPIFECTICNDTGFFENSNGNRQLCKCVKQALINERYNKSNIGNLEKDNFNNFSYNMYSDEINKEKYNSNISPRENIKHIRKIAENFINNFNDINEKNLLFTGNTGLRENISFKLYSKRIIR